MGENASKINGSELPAYKLSLDEIIGRLRIKGFTLPSLAKELNLQPNTVRMTIRRHANTGKAPRGELARRIMDEIGKRISLN